MMIRIKGIKGKVDVVDKDCATRSCFSFGFDKGSFVPGRGYTSYHKEQRPVCLRRHVHGCPTPSVCPECRLLQLEGVTHCQRCKVAVIPVTGA